MLTINSWKIVIWDGLTSAVLNRMTPLTVPLRILQMAPSLSHVSAPNPLSGQETSITNNSSLLKINDILIFYIDPRDSFQQTLCSSKRINGKLFATKYRSSFSLNVSSSTQFANESLKSVYIWRYALVGSDTIKKKALNDFQCLVCFRELITRNNLRMYNE